MSTRSLAMSQSTIEQIPMDLEALRTIIKLMETASAMTHPKAKHTAEVAAANCLEAFATPPFMFINGER